MAERTMSPTDDVKVKGWAKIVFFNSDAGLLSCEPSADEPATVQKEEKELVKVEEVMHVLEAQQITNNKGDPNTKVYDGNNVTKALASSQEDKEGACSVAEKKRHGMTVKVKNNVGGRTTGGQKEEKLVKLEQQIQVLEGQQVTNSKHDPSTKVNDGNDALEARLQGVEGIRSEAQMKGHGTSNKVNNHVGGRPLMTRAGQKRRNSLAAIENVGKDEKGAAGPSSAQQKLGDKSQMPSGHVQRTKDNDGYGASEAQSAISLKGMEGTCSVAEKKRHGTTVKVKNNVGGRTKVGQMEVKEDVKEDEKIRVLLATEQGANRDLPTKVNGGDDATIGQLAISKKDKEGAGSEAEKKHHGTTVKVKNNVGGRTTAGQKKEKEQIQVREAQQVTNSKDDPSTKVNDGNDASEAQSAISLKNVEGIRPEAEMKGCHGTSVKVNNNDGGRALMMTAGQTRRNSLAAIGNLGKDKGAAEPSRAQQKLGDKTQMPSGHVQRVPHSVPAGLQLRAAGPAIKGAGPGMKSGPVTKPTATLAKSRISGTTATTTAGNAKVAMSSRKSLPPATNITASNAKANTSLRNSLPPARITASNAIATSTAARKSLPPAAVSTSSNAKGTPVVRNSVPMARATSSAAKNSIVGVEALKEKAPGVQGSSMVLRSRVRAADNTITGTVGKEKATPTAKGVATKGGNTGGVKAKTTVASKKEKENKGEQERVLKK